MNNPREPRSSDPGFKTRFIKIWTSALLNPDIPEIGLDGFGAFVLLACYMQQYGENGQAVFKNMSQIGTLFQTNSRQKRYLILKKLSSIGWVKVEQISGHKTRLIIPKWRKYQENLGHVLAQELPQKNCTKKTEIAGQDIKSTSSSSLRSEEEEDKTSSSLRSEEDAKPSQFQDFMGELRVKYSASLRGWIAITMQMSGRAWQASKDKRFTETVIKGTIESIIPQLPLLRTDRDFIKKFKGIMKKPTNPELEKRQEITKSEWSEEEIV